MMRTRQEINRFTVGFRKLAMINSILFTENRITLGLARLRNFTVELVALKERGKPEYPEKNLSEQRSEPTTNSTHK